MNEYEWRQSGKDACSHAFRAEGGYIPPRNLVSVVPLSTDDGATEEFFGPYEAFIAECGHIAPIATLMPHSAGQPCTACLVLTGALRREQPRRQSLPAFAANEAPTPHAGSTP